MNLRNNDNGLEFYNPVRLKPGHHAANESVAGSGYVFFSKLGLLFVAVLLSSHVFGTSNTSEPITMGGFGHRIVPGGTVGDTWDGAWLANDKVYLQHNDGRGFLNGKPSHDGIGELVGTPEDPSSISGINLNPGILGDFLGKKTYSTGIYEVDGVLYHNICFSEQVPGKWRFFNNSIIKSMDGGANWVNHLGETNTNIPKKKSHAMFPADHWRQLNFVKFGKGGSAPDVDNAKTYVYLGSSAKGGYYLARIKRSDLPSLDKNKIQCYIGGDGMLDNNWTNNLLQCLPITTKTGKKPFTIVYNYGLKRYLSIYFRSDAFLKPPIESSLGILEAPHPWGPWTRVLEENVNHKEGDNLTWSYLLQKFTSDNGKKMWMTATGRKPYGLQFMPVYLTTHPVKSYEAENAILKGTRVEALQDDIQRARESEDASLLKIDRVGVSELDSQIQNLVETTDKLLVKYTDNHPDVIAIRREIEELKEHKAKAKAKAKPESHAKEIKLHPEKGYSGSGYVTGFDAVGDQCLFHVNVKESGAYILNIRYNTSQYQSIDFIVNGTLREKLKLGKSEQVYATWTEMSVFSWLKKGDNTVVFKSGTAQAAEDLNLDRLSLAFYSNVPDSLPNCSPSTK